MGRGSKVLLGILVVLVLSVAVLAVALSHNSPCAAAPPLPAGTQSMRAAVHRCYGSPDVVRIEQVPRPVPTDHQMLVKVRAASINPLDWHYLSGQPYFMRLSSGWGTPQDTWTGVDFAGTVEAVGKGVTRFKPGDEVFGGRDGSAAQYLVVREQGAVALKPPNVTFEQAAAVPVAAITALQALRDHGKIRSGQSVLVNGAGGGVGTFAVEIAKSFGADVTAVTNSANLALVRSIGADHVIDYTREDFTRGSKRYDLILDCSGNHSLSSYRRVLSPAGSYVLVGEAHMGLWIEPLVSAARTLLVSKLAGQNLTPMLAELNQADMTQLAELLQRGSLTPVIDRRYPLDRMPDALRYLETGHARGKIVITIE
ncbi:MAG TPA: NAD(P)-dependent alcohol dehydrogenase [Steroidobacteraceae bacterium]|nr:NAD(P)-dependent alcohol dehydrogenase [Steroidobacteraceae bacterium]